MKANEVILGKYISKHINSRIAGLDYLIITAFVFVGLQSFSIAVFNSKYDLSCFLFLAATFVVIFFKQHNNAKRHYPLGFITSCFIFFEILIFIIFQIDVVERFISGVVWLGGLILIIECKDNFVYDTRRVVIALYFALLYTAVPIVFGFVMQEDRIFLKGFFDEPSFAGLFLYSFAAGIVSTLILRKFSYSRLCLCAAILWVAYLTQSMHLFTFLSVLLIILICNIFYFGFGNNVTIVFSIALIFLVAFAGNYVITQDHFSARLSFVDSKNLSVLSWLRGFDQAYFAAANSPLVGYGLGSTGHINFQSANSDVLYEMGHDYLNLLDGYSLFFRLTIEVGFIVLIIFITYCIGTFVKNIKLFLSKSISNKIKSDGIFLLFFSLTLYIGCLLKEPTYSRSLLYCGIFLFFTLGPNATKFR